MSNSLIENCFPLYTTSFKGVVAEGKFSCNYSCKRKLPRPPPPSPPLPLPFPSKEMSGNGLATISLQQALLGVESISNFCNECWNKFCVRCLSILHQAMFYTKQLFSHQYNKIARQVTQNIALWNRAFTEDTVHYAYYQDTCEIKNLTLLFRSVHVSSWSWPALLAETFC